MTHAPEPLPAASPAARLHLPGCTLDDLAQRLAAAGQPAYRARQVLEWVYVHHATAFEQMTSLPAALRQRLADEALIFSGGVTRETVSADGTRKLLITFGDGSAAETVWIPSDDRHTACLSSQVGCPVGCRFCASGLDGLERNLTAGEIVEQALRISHLVRSSAPAPGPGRPGDPPPRPPRLSNIVMMGMGEPLANYAAVMAAIRIINAPWGLNIGARKITLSTVGLPKQIRRLADEDMQISLALSLHATEDALRRELIPWRADVPIAELLDACAYYFRRTGREITLEYVLLEGVNMAERHARQLASIARRLRANVNLLRYNPVPGLEYRRPGAEAAHAFQKLLRAGGANAHIRTSRGKDVQAACGQLRREKLPAR